MRATATTSTLAIALRRSFLLGFSLLIAGHVASAQTVAEVGDTGELPLTAQVATGMAITTITGEIADALDVDMYRITIDEPEAFSASTVGHGGTIEDTRLFLFDADGRAVYWNDDEHVDTYFSTLPPPTDSLGPQSPGDYLLTVMSYSRHPVDTASVLLFPEPDFEPLDYTDVFGPDTLTNAPVAFWEGGTNFEQGTYEIFLTGLNGTLAAQFASYEVVVDGGSALVKWQTSSEANTVAYEVVTRSDDGAPFERAGYVPARGAGTLYSVRVDGLLPGTATFQIRAIRADYSFSEGPTVMSNIDLTRAYELTEPYPNPVTARAELELGVQIPQRVLVDVYDVLGRRVASLLDNDLPANSMQRISFDGGSLPAGLYVIRVKGEHFADTRKVTVVD